MRERRRRHDDVHFPLGGKRKRATPRKAKAVAGPVAEDGTKFRMVWSGKKCR